MTPPFQWTLLLRPIFTHLREAPLPKATSKELRETLNTPHAQNLLQGSVHRGGVGLGAEYPNCLFKKMWIKHKICTLHVYSIPEKSMPEGQGQTTLLARLAFPCSSPPALEAAGFPETWAGTRDPHELGWGQVQRVRTTAGRATRSEQLESRTVDLLSAISESQRGTAIPN